MISYRNNTRGSSMSKSLNEMSGPELVAEWNKRHPDKPVKRFGSRSAALKRFGLPPQAQTNATKKPEPQAKGLVGKFGVRATSNRAKVLNAMSLGRAVKRSVLLKAVYGSANEKNIGALSMVFKGLDLTIKADKLPYEIRRTKDQQTKEVEYGIFNK